VCFDSSTIKLKEDLREGQIHRRQAADAKVARLAHAFL
jgi:hypothetical protein